MQLLIKFNTWVALAALGLPHWPQHPVVRGRQSELNHFLVQALELAQAKDLGLAPESRPGKLVIALQRQNQAPVSLAKPAVNAGFLE